MSCLISSHCVMKKGHEILKYLVSKNKSWIYTFVLVVVCLLDCRCMGYNTLFGVSLTLVETIDDVIQHPRKVKSNKSNKWFFQVLTRFFLNRCITTYWFFISQDTPRHRILGICKKSCIIWFFKWVWLWMKRKGKSSYAMTFNIYYIKWYAALCFEI